MWICVTVCRIIILLYAAASHGFSRAPWGSENVGADSIIILQDTALVFQEWTQGTCDPSVCDPLRPWTSAVRLDDDWGWEHMQWCWINEKYIRTETSERTRQDTDKSRASAKSTTRHWNVSETWLTCGIIIILHVIERGGLWNLCKFHTFKWVWKTHKKYLLRIVHSCLEQISYLN